MKEYEYSFKVKSLDSYIKYCEENGYKKTSETSQIRELFTSNNKILARITTKKSNDKIIKSLDFKDENDSDEILKNCRETKPLIITDDNKESINSILDILGYKKKKHLDRKRVVYEKGTVKFEIDDYSSPEKMFVVAIEGEKEAVDKTYDIISKTIHEKI